MHQTYQAYLARLPQGSDDVTCHVDGEDLIAIIAFSRGPRDPVVVANEIARDRLLTAANLPALWEISWYGFPHYGGWQAKVKLGVAGKLTGMAPIAANIASRLATYPVLDEDLWSAAEHWAAEQALEHEDIDHDDPAAVEAAYQRLRDSGELDADGFEPDDQ